MIKSKVGMLIFLKVADGHVVNDTVNDLKKCFKNGKCEIFKHYHCEPVFTDNTFSLPSYQSILWLNCEGQSHLEYIRPLIRKRLQQEPKLDSFDIYSVKNVAIQKLVQPCLYLANYFIKPVPGNPREVLIFSHSRSEVLQWSFAEWSNYYWKMLTTQHGVADFPFLMETKQSAEFGLVAQKTINDHYPVSRLSTNENILFVRRLRTQQRDANVEWRMNLETLER